MIQLASVRSIPSSAANVGSTMEIGDTANMIRKVPAMTATTVLVPAPGVVIYVSLADCSPVFSALIPGVMRIPSRREDRFRIP